MGEDKRIERFEDVGGLFAAAHVQASYGGINCDWCGARYAEDPSEGESIEWAFFGGKQVCACCFGAVEAAVLGKMSDILPWFARLLEARRAKLARDDKAVEELKQMVAGVLAAKAAPASGA
jgi:hypothetical protein